MDRFWNKVKKSNNCWEWIGKSKRCGYGCKQNMKDAMERGRLRPVRGEDTKKHKLTEDQVIEILKSSDPQRTLAKKFNVSKWTIQNIKERRYWKFVLPEKV